LPFAAVALLLLLRPVQQEQLRDDGVTAHGPSQTHPSAREFFGHVGIAGHRDDRAAVLGRDGQPEDAQVLHRVDQLVRVLVRVLQLAHHRQHVALDEVTHGEHVVELLLSQIHHYGPFFE
jgi:hypothetical protein